MSNSAETISALILIRTIITSFFLWLILFWGEPDLLDAIIQLVLSFAE